MTSRLVLACVLAGVALASTGCVRVKPWERDPLARRDMAFEPDSNVIDVYISALRKKLENADAELTAMTLSLEAQRKKAEDTLTLLAAAEAAMDPFRPADMIVSPRHTACMRPVPSIDVVG